MATKKKKAVETASIMPEEIVISNEQQVIIQVSEEQTVELLQTSTNSLLATNVVKTRH